MAGYWKGKKFSEEHKNNLRVARTRRIITIETRKKMSLSHIGKKFSKEHKKALSRLQWKGGIHKDVNGYVWIYKPTHPYGKRIRGKVMYVLRSHLVMEKHLGRFLKHEEIIHHINHIRDDDRIENLKLFPNHKEHMKLHNVEGTHGWKAYWRKKRQKYMQ